MQQWVFFCGSIFDQWNERGDFQIWFEFHMREIINNAWTQVLQGQLWCAVLSVSILCHFTVLLVFMFRILFSPLRVFDHEKRRWDHKLPLNVKVCFLSDFCCLRSDGLQTVCVALGPANIYSTQPQYWWPKSHTHTLTHTRYTRGSGRFLIWVFRTMKQSNGVWYHNDFAVCQFVCVSLRLFWCLCSH